MSHIKVGNEGRKNIPISGPFGDSMSAAARPKRWGVSRQTKGEEFDSARGRTFHPTYLTGRATKGTWGNLGRQKEKRNDIHMDFV